MKTRSTAEEVSNTKSISANQDLPQNKELELVRKMLALKQILSPPFRNFAYGIDGECEVVRLLGYF